MKALPPEGAINRSRQPGWLWPERRASILVVRTMEAVWGETSLRQSGGCAELLALW